MAYIRRESAAAARALSLANAAAGIVLTGMFFCVGLIVLVLELGQGYLAHRICRLWAKTLLACLRIKLVVSGQAHVAQGQSALVIANHCSSLDIPVMLAAFPGPIRFVAKQELKSVPIIGWVMVLAGHYAINRSNPYEARRVMQRVETDLRERPGFVMIFPEGGYNHTDGKLRPFKLGAFAAAVNSGVAIYPVAIIGAHRIWPDGALAPAHGGKIYVHIARPIWPNGQNRADLVRQSRRTLVTLGISDSQ